MFFIFVKPPRSSELLLTYSLYISYIPGIDGGFASLPSVLMTASNLPSLILLLGYAGDRTRLVHNTTSRKLEV